MTVMIVEDITDDDNDSTIPFTSVFGEDAGSESRARGITPSRSPAAILEIKVLLQPRVVFDVRDDRLHVHDVQPRIYVKVEAFVE